MEYRPVRICRHQLLFRKLKICGRICRGYAMNLKPPWSAVIALYSVMDIVYIFLILLIPSFLHKCKHAKTVRHNYSYAKRQNNQSTWVLGISHMGLRYNILEFN